MPKEIREFKIGDFLTEEFKNSTTKQGAKEENGVIDYDTIQKHYKPAVVELKAEMGKAKTQEEFDNIVENFGKDYEEKLSKKVSDSLNKLKKVNDNLPELAEVNSFSEIKPETISKLDDEDKKKVTEMQGVEKLIKEDLMKDIALRPSTYSFDKNVGDMGEFSREKDIISLVAGGTNELSMAEKIKNNKTLNENYDLQQINGTPIQYTVEKDLPTDDTGRPIQGAVAETETKNVSTNPASVIKEQVLGELLSKAKEQEKELLDLNTAKKQGIKDKNETVSYDGLSDVKLLLAKDEKFENAFKYRAKEHNVEGFDKEKAGAFAKHFKEQVAELMPSKEDLTTKSVRNFENSAKIASYNPQDLLKDKQEESFTFVGAMFRENPSSIRDIPDDLVKQNTVIQKIADEKLGKSTDPNKSKYALQSPTKIAEVNRQLDYIEAVKNGTKDEYVAKEKEEFKASLGKGNKKEEKSDKTGIEEAKTATQSEKSEVKKDEAVETKKEEPTEVQKNEPAKGKDEFPF